VTPPSPGIDKRPSGPRLPRTALLVGHGSRLVRLIATNAA
jgi:hypothetical protein